MASDHDYRLSGRTAHHKTVKHTSLNLTVPVFVACVAFRIHFCSVRKRKWILIRKGLVNRCVTQQFQCFFWYLPPANEVWGKVIFSQVFFHPRGVSVWCHFLSGYLFSCSFWGVSVQGGLCPWGSLCRRGMETPPPPNQKSGRYASYYLLQMISNCDTVNFIQEFFSWNFRHNNNSDLFCLRQPWLLLNSFNWNTFGIVLVCKLSRGSHESTTVANFSTVMEICSQ